MVNGRALTRFEFAQLVTFIVEQCYWRNTLQSLNVTAIPEMRCNKKPNCEHHGYNRSDSEAIPHTLPHAVYVCSTPTLNSGTSGFSAAASSARVIASRVSIGSMILSIHRRAAP